MPISVNPDTVSLDNNGRVVIDDPAVRESVRNFGGVYSPLTTNDTCNGTNSLSCTNTTDCSQTSNVSRCTNQSTCNSTGIGIGE